VTCLRETHVFREAQLAANGHRWTHDAPLEVEEGTICGILTLTVSHKGCLQPNAPVSRHRRRQEEESLLWIMWPGEGGSCLYKVRSPCHVAGLDR